MPGANGRALEKARTLPADTLILDLEDAVAPDAKEMARASVKEALATGGFGPREIIVRINGLDTQWGLADLETFAGSGANGLLAPKINGPADIERLDTLLSRAGAPGDLALWVMIETPLAILHISQIAEAAIGTRLTAFVMGTNDLAKEYRARLTPGRAAFQTALQLTLTAARAFGLVAIDGVFNDISDSEGLRSECRQGRELGFDGKTLIHPAQLEAANEIFAPGADETSQARAVIEAFSDPANAGKGVLKVNGKMTELLHLEEARRIVALDEAIRAHTV
jgi:citrate lyase subunit beta/citryl-CoA lyase